MGGSLHPHWLIVAAVAVAAVPIGIGLVTAYLKISIVLGMLKNALGAQQVPGGAVIMAVATALTLQVMGPVIDATVERAARLDPKMVLRAPTAETTARLGALLQPWREFLRLHAGERELLALRELGAAGGAVPRDAGEIRSSAPQTLSPASRAAVPPKAGAAPEARVAAANEAANAAAHEGANEGTNEILPWRILITAFVLTELKEAFAMAFVLLLPFLVIDLITANILVGLGMTMVSPIMIALPLKLILFVLADGWLLLARGLVHSYQVAPHV